MRRARKSNSADKDISTARLLIKRIRKSYNKYKETFFTRLIAITILVVFIAMVVYGVAEVLEYFKYDVMGSIITLVMMYCLG